MHTVAFLNKKGGVGKTSACHHLSGALGQKGLRVLLVDADPQASLTPGACWGRRWRGRSRRARRSRRCSTTRAGRRSAS